MDPKIEQRISACAYAIWEQEGRRNGKHLEHWERAQALVAAEQLDLRTRGRITHEEAASKAPDGD
jgi:hypothetical protein